MSMRIARIKEVASTPAKGDKPAKQGLLPVSVATIWRWVRDDPDFPKPINLGPGTTGFYVSEIEAFIAKRAGREAR